MSTVGHGSAHGGGAHGSHGPFAWMPPVLIAVFTAATFGAWYGGLSPWVFAYGTLGSIGAVWAGHHYGHVMGHATHTNFYHILGLILGMVVAVILVGPLWEWRSVVTPTEGWCAVLFGSLGIIFLAAELSHIFHGWGGTFGAGLAALVVLLVSTRPEDAHIGCMPRDAAHVAAEARKPLRAAPAVTPKPTVGGKAAIDCAQLSPRAREACEATQRK